jgi:uncharacterized protein YdaU (DUF1376 family)
MRAPSFQFYPTDWLASTKVALMTPAQEGAYIRLLCYAWSDPDCSLPDDDQVLAQLSRLGEGWFNGGSTIIRECFVPHPQKPGRLVNLRLLEERNKQEAWREKSRLGGINSGKSRISTAKGGSTTLEPHTKHLVKPNGNSSSSSYKEIPPTPHGGNESVLPNRRGKSHRADADTLNGHRAGFTRFWQAYPRKQGKGLCERWWATHRPDDVLLGVMLAKIEAATQSLQWQRDGGQFIPMPATWLNQKRWEDELTAPPTKTERIPL